MMDFNIYAVPGIFVLLLGVIVWLMLANRRLKKEHSLLTQIIKTKDLTLANMEASRVSVKEVIENFMISDKIISALESGKSREDVAKMNNIDVERVETIVKLSKIKKEIK